MITIKKPGKAKVYEQYCSECGCEFTYNSEDLNSMETITCPCCKTYLTHSHHEVTSEEETLFIYYELHSNMKEGLPKNHLTLEDAIDYIPMINGQFKENSAYVVNKISIIKTIKGNLRIDKEPVYQAFGPKYKEGNR